MIKLIARIVLFGTMVLILPACTKINEELLERLRNENNFTKPCMHEGYYSDDFRFGTQLKKKYDTQGRLIRIHFESAGAFGTEYVHDYSVSYPDSNTLVIEGTQAGQHWWDHNDTEGEGDGLLDTPLIESSANVKWSITVVDNATRVMSVSFDTASPSMVFNYDNRKRLTGFTTAGNPSNEYRVKTDDYGNILAVIGGEGDEHDYSFDVGFGVQYTYDTTKGSDKNLFYVPRGYSAGLMTDVFDILQVMGYFQPKHQRVTFRSSWGGNSNLVEWNYGTHTYDMRGNLLRTEIDEHNMTWICSSAFDSRFR